MYGFDKKRFILLLDSKITPKPFLNYLEANDFQYIDMSEEFLKATKPTTLIYDRHWNNHGREIIAQLIAKKIKREL